MKRVVTVFGAGLFMTCLPVSGNNENAGYQVTKVKFDNSAVLAAPPPLLPDAQALHFGLDAPPSPSTIWERLTEGMLLTHVSRLEVDQWRDWFAQRPDMLEKIFERAQPYLYLVVDEVEARVVPAELALLPAIESGFKPKAYSRSHASGLWQFIPITAKRFGLENTRWVDARRDAQASTNAALDYLTYLHGFFGGDWLLAIAAYNAGEGTVRNAIAYNQERNLPTDFWSLRLPTETRNYVPKLLAVAQIIRQPDTYGVALPEVPNQEQLAFVAAPANLSLKKLADRFEISLANLQFLNSAIKHDRVPKGYELCLPLDRQEEVLAAFGEPQVLAQLAPAKAIRVHGHGRRVVTVRKGDTLYGIARSNGIKMRDLMRWNHMNGKTVLRPGQKLVLHGGGSGVGGSSVYVVQQGDTLYNIARRFGVHLKTLLAWNGWNHPPSVLRPGDKIVLKARQERNG